MLRIAFIFFCYAFFSAAINANERQHVKALRVLHVTDYSDFWHDYSAQARLLSEFLPELINVELTVVGRTGEDAKAILRKADFAVGYDAILYNACHADTSNFEMAANIKRQVREHQIPILFLHCAMHNFRGTSEHLGLLGQVKRRRAKNSWTSLYPDQDFPVWWRLTGVDSTSHAWPQGLTFEKRNEAHPVVRQLPDSWSTERDELYYNLAVADDVVPLYVADRPFKGRTQLVAWTREEQGVRIFATSLGHDMKTLENSVFQQLLANGLLWITGRLTDEGWPEPGFAGLESYVNYSSSIHCHPSSIIDARDVTDVQNGIRLANQRGLQVKPVSIVSSTSYSPVICPERGGLLLQLKDMNRIIKVDEERRLVTVEPGVLLSDLGKYLHKHGLFFPINPDYNAVSVAGAMGTGAHHSSLKIPATVSDWVESMKIVDGSGRLRQLSGDQLRAGAVHVGLLGVVVEVTLRVIEEKKIEYHHVIENDGGDLAERLLNFAKSHDYARASWFPNSGRVVMEAKNFVSVDTPGESYHNLWEASADIFNYLGDAPNRILNSNQGIQCAAETVRSRLWQSSFEAVDSRSARPVGWAHRMLASDCQAGRCPWELGSKNRTMELAISLDQLGPWLDDVRQILQARRACFPILGIYLRFAKAGETWLGMNAGKDVVMFEIHIPTLPNADGFEASSEVYDEIQQLSLKVYSGRPHWGKNSAPTFRQVGENQYPNWWRFHTLRRNFDPRGIFLSEFWRTILSEGEEADHYFGCVYDRTCICQKDSDCGSGRKCGDGGFFTEARVCLARD